MKPTHLLPIMLLCFACGPADDAVETAEAEQTFEECDAQSSCDTPDAPVPVTPGDSGFTKGTKGRGVVYR